MARVNRHTIRWASHTIRNEEVEMFDLDAVNATLNAMLESKGTKSRKQKGKDKTAMIASINGKLNKELKKHKGFANLKDAGLTKEEMQLIAPYAREGSHGPYITWKGVMKFLEKEGGLKAPTFGVQTGMRDVRGRTAGGSEYERAGMEVGYDPRTGKPYETGPPEHIKDAGPYGPGKTGSLKQSKDRKKELAAMARKKRTGKK
jgi:hypothetical protein